MTTIVIKNLLKTFGETTAVANVNLTINSGELFCLLGPSGCGKTTLLRMIAGFVDPTAGSISFNTIDVTHLPPNRRDAGMVFQSYALWPHMTVIENVAYGLSVRKIPRVEKHDRAHEALRMVHMDHLASRKPNQLSGGQQQRIALARALVIKPTVLLLDEPLSNLDAKLRLEMRDEIRRICKQSKITTVYVTHDQKEAMAIADGIAVLRSGHLLQTGPPREMYNHPRTKFVAQFLGETNIIPGTITSIDAQTALVKTVAGQIRCPPPLPSSALKPGASVNISLRPESIRLQPQLSDDISFPGRITHTVYLGDSAQHTVELAPGLSVHIIELHPPESSRTEAVTIRFSVHDARIVEDDDVRSSAITT